MERKKQLKTNTMKKIKILLLATLVLFAANSCKKDYPKDIPDWLKDKIKFCDKKKNDCNELIIDEYSYEGDIYYRLYVPHSPPRQNDYYDYNGNFMCSDLFNVPCSYFVNGNLVLKRNIWQEK